MQASRLKKQTDRPWTDEQEPGNGWELLDDGPHGGGWLVGAPPAPPDPSGGLVAFADEEPGSAPGWHLYREHREGPELWSEYLGRIEEGPAGLAVTARPEQEPPAERPSPSPTGHRGPRAQPGARTPPQGAEHGEDGAAARSRAQTGRGRARGQASRDDGEAAQISDRENFGCLKSDPEPVRPYPPGVWPYRCQFCGVDSPAVRHWLELEDSPGGHGWSMVPTGTGAFRPACPACPGTGGAES